MNSYDDHTWKHGYWCGMIVAGTIAALIAIIKWAQ